jgi:hypothetical protein
MAKSTRKAAARSASRGSATSARAPKASRGAARAEALSAKGGAARTSGAARWSRGKPVAKRKAASARPARVAPAPLAIRDPSHGEIAHHAYLRWLKHGGSEHENWYAAEHELRTRRSTLRANRTPREGA